MEDSQGQLCKQLELFVLSVACYWKTCRKHNTGQPSEICCSYYTYTSKSHQSTPLSLLYGQARKTSSWSKTISYLCMNLSSPHMYNDNCSAVSQTCTALTYNLLHRLPVRKNHNKITTYIHCCMMKPYKAVNLLCIDQSMKYRSPVLLIWSIDITNMKWTNITVCDLRVSIYSFLEWLIC